MADSGCKFWDLICIQLETDRNQFTSEWKRVLANVSILHYTKIALFEIYSSHPFACLLIFFYFFVRAQNFRRELLSRLCEGLRLGFPLLKLQNKQTAAHFSILARGVKGGVGELPIWEAQSGIEAKLHNQEFQDFITGTKVTTENEACKN